MSLLFLQKKSSILKGTKVFSEAINRQVSPFTHFDL